MVSPSSRPTTNKPENPARKDEMSNPKKDGRYLIQSGEGPAAFAWYISGVFVLESDYFAFRDEDPDWKKHAVTWPRLRWMDVPRVPGREG